MKASSQPPGEWNRFSSPFRWQQSRPQLHCYLTRDLEIETPRRAIPRFLTLRNCVKIANVCCFMLLNLGVLCYAAIGTKTLMFQTSHSSLLILESVPWLCQVRVICQLFCTPLPTVFLSLLERLIAKINLITNYWTMTMCQVHISNLHILPQCILNRPMR